MRDARVFSRLEEVANTQVTLELRRGDDYTVLDTKGIGSLSALFTSQAPMLGSIPRHFLA
jgi:hypothetical protein